MNAASLKADAALGELVACAFDMFRPSDLAPTADPRLSPAWIIRGYITALDAVLPSLGPLQLGDKAYYGFLAESAQKAGQFVAVIRGTADTAEWAIDADFRQVRHPAGGMVEEGFYGLFHSMRYRPSDPAGTPDSPLGPGIARAVDQGTVTVIGHSLGAALATMATLDLATVQGLGSRVRGRFFCSPRPGDQAFADVFGHSVADAAAYILPDDLVPKVPAGFGYAPLHCTMVVGPDIAQSVIKDSRACFHHIYSILSAMDYSLMNWSAVPAIDKDLTICILGPRT